LINPISYCIIKSWKIFSSKRRNKSAHLIDDNSQRPNIAFIIVFLPFPYLRTGIVGSTSLGGSKSIISYFRNVQIPYLSRTSHVKYVCTFHISMYDIVFMQPLQPFQKLMCRLPNKLLIETTATILLCPPVYFSFKISPISVLHYNAKGLNLGHIEGTFVRYHVWHIDGSK
jgi:hypothetical protein